MCWYCNKICQFVKINVIIQTFIEPFIINLCPKINVTFFGTPRLVLDHCFTGLNNITYVYNLSTLFVLTQYNIDS